jgi:type I restriction enzyme M protein
MISGRNKEFIDGDIALIAQTYRAWRNKEGKYEDKAGLCESVTLEEIRNENNGYVLMPGRYVGTEEKVDDGIPFGEKMSALTTKLAEQFAKSNKLEDTIRKNLKSIRYEF